jgi:hypothetical protein
MAELLMWNANQYENGNFNNFVEATVKHELQYSHNQLALATSKWIFHIH